MIFVFVYLLLGIFIAFKALLLSRGKKIKPNTTNTILTVFLWLPYLIQVMWWRATLSDFEKEKLQKLIDEDE